MSTREEEYKDSLKTILDCFGGADGGVSFMQFRMAMENCVAEPSYVSDELLERMHKFSKIIKVLSK